MLKSGPGTSFRIPHECPSGPHLEHTWRPKHMKYRIFRKRNTHFHGIHKCQLLGTIGGTFSPRFSCWDPMGAPREPNGANHDSISKHFPYTCLDILSSLAADDSARCTTSQNHPNIPQDTPAPLHRHAGGDFLKPLGRRFLRTSIQ